MKKLLMVLIVLIVALCAGSAMALRFELGDFSEVTGNAFSDPGLVMQYELNPGLDDIGFDLYHVGDFYEFDFATFWTEETAVNPQDDLTPRSIEAKIDIQSPPSTGTVPGTSVGTSGWLAFFQGWKISWNDPVYVTFSGGMYSIDLTDAQFESGFWQGPDGNNCDPGKRKVFAKVTLESLSVPEPATSFFLGAGLLGLTALYRRRRT